jgi:hypothetical protein
VSKLLRRLCEWWSERGGGNCGNLMVHIDHERPQRAAVSHQFMARNAITIEVHPPHPPNLAPSDIFNIRLRERVAQGEAIETGE